MQTIVIGHKNPDMDSICSALACADLKRKVGMADVVAGRAGNTNERIDYVLRRFGFEAPALFIDVSPKVADVMTAGVSLPEEAPVWFALQRLEETQMRGLPVVDPGGNCRGLLSLFQISRHLFPMGTDATCARQVRASLRGVAESFGGRALGGALDGEEKEFILVIGAMSEGTFSRRMEQYEAGQVILITGDREPIQREAVRRGVGAVVVTGDLPVENSLLAEAQAAGVAVIGSPHDSATTFLRARGAERAGRMIETDFVHFHPDTPLESARNQATTYPGAHVFPVLDDAGRLAGVTTRGDFLQPPARQLILVDHNELSQAVDGADRVPIIEVLDHHRLGGFSSNAPLHFWNNPVGSTCTIVALCYGQAGLEVPPGIAGLLMAGLIADTLNLTSPTATEIDARILRQLARIQGEDPKALAERIFSVGSPLLTLAAKDAVGADSKEYEERGVRFSVAQIEELSFSHFPEKKADLLDALEKSRAARGLLFAALMVTDINTQTSLLLVAAPEEFLRTIDYPAQEPGIWLMQGVVSRKKQLVPYLLRCVERWRV